MSLAHPLNIINGGSEYRNSTSDYDSIFDKGESLLLLWIYFFCYKIVVNYETTETIYFLILPILTY